MFDFDAFRTMFSEFDCMSDEEIQPAIDLACAIWGDFCYIENPKTRNILVNLSIAHELKLGDCLMAGGAIKRIKNQADEIEYARGNSSDPFGLNSTMYGAKLARLTRVLCASTGFLGGGVPSMYTSDIGFEDNCCCD